MHFTGSAKVHKSEQDYYIVILWSGMQSTNGLVSFVDEFLALCICFFFLPSSRNKNVANLCFLFNECGVFLLLRSTRDLTSTFSRPVCLQCRWFAHNACDAPKSGIIQLTPTLSIVQINWCLAVPFACLPPLYSFGNNAFDVVHDVAGVMNTLRMCKNGTNAFDATNNL